VSETDYLAHALQLATWMRSRRTWVVVAAVLIALVVIVLLALPMGVRLLAEGYARELLGREVTIGDIDVNLFTGHLVASDIQVHGGRGEQAPLRLRRLDTRYHLMPLLRGRVHLDRLALNGLDVYLQRTAPDRFNVSDVVARVSARPAREPVQAVVGTLVVTHARARLNDQVADPDRTWTLGDLALEAHDVVTLSDAAQGRASATFFLAGAPGVLTVQGLGLRPPQGRVMLGLEGLELGQLGAYFPGDAAVRLAGGRATTHLIVHYDAAGTVRGRGEVAFRELSFSRRGQDPPLLTVPAASVMARDLAYVDGDIAAGRLELAADRLTLLDATGPRARPLDVTALRASWKARGPAPGELALGADLPEGARLDVAGTADVLPLTADLRVDVKGLDVALAQLWMPHDAALMPASGRVAAGLDVSYGEANGVVAGGEIRVEELTLARADQDTPFLRDERIVAEVRELTVRDGTLGIRRLEVSGSPTLTDTSVTPPGQLHLPRLALVAEGAALPGGRPARVRAEATLPRGGRLEASGTAGLAPASLSLDVRAHDADLTLAAPYVPAQAPVALDRGRLEARLSVDWDGALRVGGRLVARDLALLRRGQAEPFIYHPSLTATLTGLVVRDGQASLERLVLEGTPTIVDATASPPQRFAVQALTLAMSDFTWPGRRPARVQGSATVADGGRAQLGGTIHPGTLATDVRARFDNVDATRANGYLPWAAQLDVAQGRAEATVTLRHRRADGVRLDAEGVVHALMLTLMTGPGLRIHDEWIEFAVNGLVVRDGTLSLDAATVDGTPVVARAGGETAAALSRLRADLQGLRYPGGPDASWQVVAEPLEGGRVVGRGTFAPATRTLGATVEADNAGIAVAGALLPVRAAVDGRLDARLVAEVGADRSLTLEGEATLHEVTIGPDDTAPIRIARVTATDFELHGRELAAARVALEQPAVVLEREASGSFPLRAMLTPAPPPAASSSEGPGRERPVPETEQEDPLRFTVAELVIRDGNIRFIDRTTTPFYSEELDRLAVTIRDLTNTSDRPAQAAIEGIVGVDAALDLKGQVGAFARPLFLDVSGELRHFSVPRTNPYLQRFLDWIARRGDLTTQVHYRIEDDRLTATNEVVVQRLDVERARDEDRSERLVGLPLGLVVALLKDARGDIRITVPVAGDLDSPKFSFGDAIRTALKNVVGRLVTAPFRVIGSVFRRDGEVEDVAIEPVTFPAGSTILTPEATAHLQRVADFLRASPYIRLTLEPVVSEGDLWALRVQEVTARIQRLQREEGIDDFGAAARELWARGADAPLPEEPPAIVRALAERQPVPTEAAHRLAERRTDVTRAHLVEAAGIPGDRLLVSPGASPIGVTADGRVEFGLRPAS
jgi:hypothetical protein